MRISDWCSYVCSSDLRLPCDPGRQIAFSRSSDPREYWVALVEKAFAKRAGSYAALLSGCNERFEAREDSIVTALRLMSGGHVEKIHMFDAGDDMVCAKYLTTAHRWGIGAEECDVGKEGVR